MLLYKENDPMIVHATFVSEYTFMVLKNQKRFNFNSNSFR